MSKQNPDRQRWIELRKQIRELHFQVYEANKFLDQLRNSKTGLAVNADIYYSSQVYEKKGRLNTLLVEYRKEYGIPGDACRANDQMKG